MAGSLFAGREGGRRQGVFLFLLHKQMIRRTGGKQHALREREGGIMIYIQVGDVGIILPASSLQEAAWLSCARKSLLALQARKFFTGVRGRQAGSPSEREWGNVSLEEKVCRRAQQAGSTRQGMSHRGLAVFWVCMWRIPALTEPKSCQAGVGTWTSTCPASLFSKCRCGVCVKSRGEGEMLGFERVMR